MKHTGEQAFEAVIEAHLLANGYVSVAGGGFDQKRAIFPETVLAFSRETQPKEWAKLEALHDDRTGEQILDDLCKWMDIHGSLATLRHGFKCYGRTLRAAYFKAAHELNPELESRYAANRLGLTRQLHFSARSPHKSLDVTLSLNGIPVATVELKNPLTGQRVEDARRQYKQDRDPREPIFEFKRRTLVHFAVDTESVLMTTLQKFPFVSRQLLLERLYVFFRHLAAKLPRRRSGPAYRFDDEVQLEYYRLQKISEGSISLAEGEARPLDGPTEVGTGLARPQPVPLSQLIDIVNTRFGTDFNQADQLFFDQVVEAAMANDGVRQAAAVNPGDKFELVFKGLLENLFVERMDQNEEIFVRFMNDPSFQKIVTAWMASEAYRRLKSDDARGRAEIAKPSALPLQLRIVEPRLSERYLTCVPLVPLKAAAGAFSDPQRIDDNDFAWVAIETTRRLRRGMFVAQVVGKSMEPIISDSAYCLFAAPVGGSRQGKTVLVQMRDDADPETGERYTVKRYTSEKAGDGDSWQHTKITLSPVNPDFEPIVLTGADEGSLQVVAENRRGSWRGSVRDAAPKSDDEFPIPTHLHPDNSGCGDSSGQIIMAS